MHLIGSSKQAALRTHAARPVPSPEGIELVERNSIIAAVRGNSLQQGETKMGWCPNCGYEYRPEVQQCPNCGLALVAEPPADIPRVAGLRVEAKTARVLSRLAGSRESIAAVLQPAWTAAEITFRAKKLLLVIALLATIWFAGNLALNHYLTQRFSSGGPPPPMPERGSLPDRWVESLHHRTRLGYLLDDFYSPLQEVAGFLSPWLSLPFWLLTRVNNTSSQPTSPQVLLQYLAWLIESLLAIAIEAAILAGLLGWLRAIATGTPPKSWGAYLRDHYRPLLVLGVCVTLGIQLTMLPAELAQTFLSFSASGWKSALRNAGMFVSFDLFARWIMPLGLLALALAPFSIVARNLGAWGGAKAGARSLWQHRWIALGLFVVYRVIHEVVQLGALALPPMRFVALFQFGLRPIIGLWVVGLAFAFLGLWLAMAFTMLVAAEKPLEQAAESAG